jgi:hypothetical protein
MAHFFRDVGHRQILLARQIREQEELGERDVPFVEFGGQVQDTASLGEQDEIRESVDVGRRRHAAGTGVCFHVWLVVLAHTRRHDVGRIRRNPEKHESDRDRNEFKKLFQENRQIQVGLFENKDILLIWEEKNSRFLKYF